MTIVMCACCAWVANPARDGCGPILALRQHWLRAHAAAVAWVVAS